MANGMNIKVNGVTIKIPSACAIEKYNITKSGRVANGSMTMDLIAQKAKLNLTYDVVSGTDLAIIKGIIYSTTLFFTVDYNDDDGVAQTKTMYCGDIAYDRFRTDGVWYWKNFKVNLIEV